MTDTTQPVDENHLIAERRSKLAAQRANGIAFPNDFKRGDFAGDLQAEYADADQWTSEALDASGRRVAVVSSGDAGVYGMAGLVLEVLDQKGLSRQLDCEIVPGVPRELQGTTQELLRGLGGLFGGGRR